MKNKEKAYSIALASTFIILFLILVSSTASASIEEDPNNINPPDSISGTGSPSNDKVPSDELSIEEKSIVTAAPIIAETRITTGEVAWTPDIYGDRIVYVREFPAENSAYVIYIYNLSTKKTTQIPDIYEAFGPVIYGNRIAYTYGHSYPYVAVYDLSTEETTQIPTYYAGWDLDVYGNKIVLIDTRDDENWANSDIYIYDLSTSTETQITTNESSQIDPAIYGNRIVWADGRNRRSTDDYYIGNWDIYMYDISTQKETQITTNTSMQANPAIYGDRIVWQDNRSGNWDIYMYNLSTKKETRITTNKSDSLYPVIYGNNIVWQDNRNGNWDIYVYNLVTHEQSHTADTSNQYEPAIYGDRIVWVDHRNGEYSPDIYMGTLVTARPIASFSASPTSGKAPLNVTFTDKSTRTPTSWNWTFGDGTNSTEQNPTHRYRAEGNYTVKLTAINALGSNTTTKTNYIKVTPTNTRPGPYSQN